MKSKKLLTLFGPVVVLALSLAVAADDTKRSTTTTTTQTVPAQTESTTTTTVPAQTQITTTTTKSDDDLDTTKQKTEKKTKYKDHGKKVIEKTKTTTDRD